VPTVQPETADFMLEMQGAARRLGDCLFLGAYNLTILPKRAAKWARIVGAAKGR